MQPELTLATLESRFGWMHDNPTWEPERTFIYAMWTEIERLRGLSDITRLDVMWQALVKERYAAENNATVLAAEVNNSRAEIERLRLSHLETEKEIERLRQLLGDSEQLKAEIEQLRAEIEFLELQAKLLPPLQELAEEQRTEIEQLRRDHEKAWADAQLKAAEIEQLRKERDSAFETWKAMHVATLNGFIKQHHEPLKTEIEQLRAAMEVRERDHREKTAEIERLRAVVARRADEAQRDYDLIVAKDQRIYQLFTWIENAATDEQLDMPVPALCGTTGRQLLWMKQP